MEVTLGDRAVAGELVSWLPLQHPSNLTVTESSLLAFYNQFLALGNFPSSLS